MSIAVVVVLVLLAGAHASGVKYGGYGQRYINYTSVPGYFLQDDISTNATTFDYTKVNFGLINQTYKADDHHHGNSHLTQWQRFEREVLRLQREAPKNVDYKVLFMGRHGEGWHNAEESYVGTPAWNCYYAELNGNSTATWSDAHLTANGVAQALVANNFWSHLISVQKIHTPDSFYTSPLYRCLSTANLTFSGLNLPRHSEFIPTVKELLREGIDIHTCDRRSSKAFIHSSFPSYKIESGFAEHDPLWNGVTAETSSSQDVRSRTLLNDIFSHDKHTYISITSHSGELGSILRVLNHRAFSLNTGAVIPVLVKAETIDAREVTTTTTQPWTVSPHCTTPPLSSISGGACVCPSSAAPVTTPLVPTAAPQRMVR